MKMFPRRRLGLLAAGMTVFALWANGGVGRAASELEQKFAAPPAEARPWVYWFWLNGNITREGITADLEAMRRVGIGGVLIMEVDQGAPVGPVGFMGPKWRELFRHVVSEASRLGLEVNMNNDAGWNGSGGPWIKPEESMQQVVWSEIELSGPKRVEVVLPKPRTVAGYYREIAVLAFPSVGSYRIDRIKAKALYETAYVGPPEQKDLASEKVIDPRKIVNLSGRMDATGRLSWEVPTGEWTVLRLGHTSTGAENAPAPESGRGLECDKLSREGAEANFKGMMAKLIADNPAAAGKALAATHVDSWENGAQNWTARMREEFRGRRGYDLVSYLPAMTGRVVGTLEMSERFLWDLRRTVSDLVVENYAGRIRELAHEHGLRLTIEAYGSPCDFVPYAGQCDEPMGEFWMGGNALETCKGMASAGHVYGKRIIGAESFTAADHERWLDHPATIKSLGDRAFCEGINRFVFHRYAMQPWLDRRPGMTMGPWGLHYERTQTWWELSPEWHRYLARCQYLLRQGRFVADICYLDSEESPHGFQDRKRQGYDWDQASPEVALTRMRVVDGRVVLPDGVSYRVLVLPDSPTMTPKLLGRIKELVEAGATVLGPRPSRSPSLVGYPACDEEVKRLAGQLWGNSEGQGSGEHRFGKGRVVWGITAEELLARDGVRPDFTGHAYLRFIHRDLGDSQLYFVASRLPHDAVVSPTFRVSGKVPELWWPDSGRLERAAVYDEKEGRTRVLLPLGPSGSVFVLFRNGHRSGDSVVSLDRDGKPVFAVSQHLPRIVVTKATYGVPGDEKRTRDVREVVQRKADGGEDSIRVVEMAKGGDPAVNAIKTLSVDYSIGPQEYSVKGQDGGMVYLAGDAVQIVVEKARYGVLDDPARTRDVKAKVQQIADAGENSFSVARMAQGDDPAFGIVKTLEVEYTVKGERVSARGTDSETITLGPPPKAAERIAQIERGKDGGLMLEAWRPGRYEVKMASGEARRVNIPMVPAPVAVASPWEVSFPPGGGAPERITMERLASWTEHKDPGVKYFSGTAAYRATFEVPRELVGQQRRRAWLDLGNVQVMAQVKLNGNDLGVQWKLPFRTDVTAALAAGENRLEVRVTNLWPNRMIGDAHLPEDSARNPEGTLKEWPRWLLEGKPSPTGRVSFTTWRLWKKDSPLLPSGLLGPVMIQWSTVQEVPRQN